jgi:hypothetical protein
MNKFQIIFILIFVLISSCRQESSKTVETKELNKQKNNIQAESSKGNESTVISNPLEIKYKRVKNDTILTDTLYNKDFLITVETVTKDSFINLLSENRSKLYENLPSKYKETFNEYVKRVNDSTLLIALKTGEIDSLKDVKPGKGYLGFSLYKYVDYLKEIHSHLIYGHYYEAEGYFLINDSTGEKMEKILSNNLCVNEKENRLITFAYDGFAYNTGGLKIYDISTGEIVELVDCYQKNPQNDGYYWGISDVHWINENEIACRMELYMLKGKRRNHSLRTFVKLKIIKNYNR